MRDSLPISVFSFFAGALLGGSGVCYFMSRTFDQTLALLALGDAAKAEVRAMVAYQHEKPVVAIWELRQFIESQRERVRRNPTESRELQAGLFLAYGRLAKLYAQEGRDIDADANAKLAIGIYREIFPTKTTITNLSTLLELIQRLDHRAKKEPQ